MKFDVNSMVAGVVVGLITMYLYNEVIAPRITTTAGS